MANALLIFIDAVKLWVERNAFLHAGALAFYTLFSLAPLVIIVVSIVGIVYGEQAASGQISSGIAGLVGPQAAAAVEEAVRQSRPQEAGLWPSMMGLGALLFGATTVFAQMQGSLNEFWGVRPRPTRSGVLNFITVRLLSLGMVLIIGFLLLTSFVLSVAISGLIEYAGQWMAIPPLVLASLSLLVSLLVTTALFGLLYKILPDVHLSWADVRRAALFTASLFIVGQYLISFYLTTAAPASTYGAAGSLVLILMWVYYSSLILFFGTALIVAAIRRRDGGVTPKRTAVRSRVVIVEE